MISLQLSSRVRIMRKLLIPVLIMFSLLTAPAQAAESRKELGERLDALTARVKVLEDRMLTGDPAAVRLQERIDSLEKSMREQTGENERLRFENQQQREDIKTLKSEMDLIQSDLNKALSDSAEARRALGAYITGDTAGGDDAEATGADNPVQDTAASGDVAADSPDADFAQARKYLNNGDFDQAGFALNAFVQKYPKNKQAGEALFWLGEIAMVRNDPHTAASLYIKTLKEFPKGRLAPDAMVKLASALNALGDKKEACNTLKVFPKQYPKAGAAVKAKAGIEAQRAGCSQ